MLQKALKLRGCAVVASHGHLGWIGDLQVDPQSWQVRYLRVVGQRRPALLVPAACVVASHPRTRTLLVDLPHWQASDGAGAWSAERAGRWLEPARACSVLELVTLEVEAQDGTAGRIAELLLDEELWTIDYLLVDTTASGAPRQVLVPTDWMGPVDVPRRRARLRRTRAQLADSPSV